MVRSKYYYMFIRDLIELIKLVLKLIKLKLIFFKNKNNIILIKKLN